MHATTATFPDAFRRRYGQLARAAGLDASSPIAIALSGGADSVYLLHLVAGADPRPAALAIHIDHGLRGAESDRDALFCERLCRRLGIDFVLRRAALDAQGPSLEARAREARYRLLLEEAERRGIEHLLTGHHADDALETLLMRMSRGTALGGLAGLRARSRFAGPLTGAPIEVVRLLLHMRREEVRCVLRAASATWCEDSSNLDARFTRNRVRETLLPRIGELGGEASLDHLRAFGAAVERLEHSLALATAHLAWRPLDTAHASRAHADLDLGGSVERAELMRLPGALRRRAVWRLVQEGCGRAPRSRLLELVLDDLDRGRTARHALPRGWQLELRSARVDLLPPDSERALAKLPAPRRAGQAELPFPNFGGPIEVAVTPAQSGARRSPSAGQTARRAEPRFERALAHGGIVDLGDGRRIGAEWVVRELSAPPPHSPWEVELALATETAALAVRFPCAGDRFHPLGGPGARAVSRFLADSGVPRRERRFVPLVTVDGEIAWVVGLRPAERHRVHADTRRRLRLRLYGAADSSASRARAPRLATPELFGEPDAAGEPGS